jgi:hypothetical protein
VNTQIIEHQKVSAIVENVNLALSDIQQAFTLLERAKNRLHATLGHNNTYYDSLWEHDLTDYRLGEKGQDCLAHVTKNAWKYIVSQTGITHYMTPRRKEALQEQIKKGDVPALTVENIMGTLQSLAEQTPQLLQESIKEVFDWLRPTLNWGVGKHKTNKKFRIGYKVILGSAVQRHWHADPWHFNYYREDNFRALGNVFSLLDGQGVERYPYDFVTRFKEGMKEHGGDTFTDQYFHCVAYKNRNLHVAFLRHDLVDEINKIAGGMALHTEETD